MRVDGELGGAVGVGRPGRRVLADRHLLGLAVGGRGGGEDDPPAVGRAHRLEQRQRARRRWCPSTPRAAAGTPRPGSWRRSAAPPRAGRRPAPAPSRAATPRRTPAPSGTASAWPVDRSSSTVTSWPAGQQGGRDYAADVAGAAGDEYAHGRHPRSEEATSWYAHAPRCRRCPPTGRAATRPTWPARSASTGRSSWPATRSPSRRCRPSSRRWPPAAADTNRYPDNGAVVLTRALAGPLRRRPRAGGHRLRRGHAAAAARPGLQRPGHEHRLRLALVRDVPAARPGRRRAGDPGAAGAGPPRRPGRHPRPRGDGRRDRRHAPAWCSSATRTTPPGRRCGGPSWSSSWTPSRSRPWSSSTRPTASSSPTPTSPTASS